MTQADYLKVMKSLLPLKMEINFNILEPPLYWFNTWFRKEIYMPKKRIYIINIVFKMQFLMNNTKYFPSTLKKITDNQHENIPNMAYSSLEREG